MIRTRMATREDALYLAPRLRDADKRELQAGGCPSPEFALLEGLRPGFAAWVALMPDDTPFAMGGFGSPPGAEDVAIVWLLSTPDIHKVRIPFLRTSRRWVEAAQDEFRVLTNIVDARNTLHVKWLRWLGFTFINRKPLGANGEEFLEFVRIK